MKSYALAKSKLLGSRQGRSRKKERRMDEILYASSMKQMPSFHWQR
jgi:hypothetical protein